MMIFVCLIGLLLALASASVGIVTLRMRDSMGGAFSGMYGGQIRRTMENNKGSLEMQATRDAEARGILREISIGADGFV